MIGFVCTGLSGRSAHYPKPLNQITPIWKSASFSLKKPKKSNESSEQAVGNRSRTPNSGVLTFSQPAGTHQTNSTIEPDLVVLGGVHFVRHPDSICHCISWNQPGSFGGFGFGWLCLVLVAESLFVPRPQGNAIKSGLVGSSGHRD